jgi:hypothetical protein
MAAKRRPSYLSPFALARRNGLYKGVLGGDRRWLVVGGVVWGARFLRKSLGKSEQVVALEKLEPGQWMSVRAISPAERKAEKAAGKAVRKRRAASRS